MAVREDYVEFISEQLSLVGKIEMKKMFGGYGIFKEGLMFGMIGGDTFRLKVDDTNKQDFIDKGMKPYKSKSKKKGMPYWEVPPEVVEDKGILAEWAGRSFEIAKTAKKN